MDIELAMDSLNYAMRSAEILGIDGGKIGLWKDLRDNLEPLKIGSDGRLLEWDKESRVEFEPGHRHVSHLYGLYPADIMNEYDEPALYRAARKSLDQRLSCGGGHTGWSRAWSSCLYGKLGEKDLFLEHYEKLITDFATDSLLDVNPYVEPERIFQIDGNLGAVAAVLEALVSNSGGRVRLLRALPDVWANGTLKGVCLPGGHKISFSWKDGRAVRLEVEFGFEEEIAFAVNGTEFTAKKSDGITVFEF
jgi:alpha-L-fucosidase 2